MTTINQISVESLALTDLALLEIEQDGVSKKITALNAKDFFKGVPEGGTSGQVLSKISNDDGDADWATLDKNSLGLGSVDNTSDMDKPVSTAQAAADAATLVSANAYTDNKVTGLFDFRGNYDASTGTYPTTGGSGTAGAVVKGDIWRISVTGTGALAHLRVGDSLYATIDTPAQVANNWGTILLELGYNPEDVANKVTSFSSPTNTQYPSALLVKTQLDLKLTDVTNGTGTGVTQVTTPSANVREVARLGAASTDVVVTQGAAGAPNTVGLNGTTLKYWEETSTAIDASTQRLAWRPKDPNGTFVRANTVQVIAVPRGITFRDPLESGTTFPNGFTTGLDLQIKGTTGTATKHANGGYCFGEGNTGSGALSVAVGIGNSCGGVSGGVAFGRNNSVSTNLGVAGVSLGVSNAAGYGIAIGNGNASTGSNPSIALGIQCAAAGSNSTAVGVLNTQSVAAINSVGVGREIAQTAPQSVVMATRVGSVVPSDQGISGFNQFGRQGAIPINVSVTGITDWTNTAWRDVATTTMSSLYNSPVGSKFSANLLVKLTQDIAAGGIQVPTRTGVILLEAWRDGGDIIPTIKVLQGGDINFLTFFDFQFVIVGQGVKMQWKFVLDPSGASPNAGQVDFWGELSNAVSANS